ncbi:MAG: hypothetical protein J7M05_13660, partial [Anaerolineae bacterium]|nr:hypothetical protein [Anaerolineae bacterium]
MSKKTWVILIFILLGLCGLGGLCLTTGYIGYKILTSPKPEPQIITHPSERARGGTLRLSGSPPATLDPAMVQDSTSAEYVFHLFSGLVRLNEELQVVPDLATQWEISPDGRTFTFYLRPGATFQNGRAITSRDVIYSLERALQPSLGSPVALSYLGDIVGAEALARGETDHLAGVKALDDHTIQITIDEAKAYFLAKLTYPTAFVVDREQIERKGEAWVRNPNGSGPFVLEELTKEHIVLRRNKRYYGKLPALDRVEYIFSGGVPITMYENNQLDIVEV